MDFQLVWYERKGGLELGAIKRAGPTKVQLIDARGKYSVYHNHAIQPWAIAETGEVTNALA